jgi:hypothetical protein
VSIARFVKSRAKLQKTVAARPQCLSFFVVRLLQFSTPMAQNFSRTRRNCQAITIACLKALYQVFEKQSHHHHERQKEATYC